VTSRMRSGANIRGSVGAVTAKAALLALTGLALPAAALASSPANEAVVKAEAAIRYAGRSSGGATTMPRLSAATVPPSGGVVSVPVTVPAPPVSVAGHLPADPAAPNGIGHRSASAMGPGATSGSDPAAPTHAIPGVESAPAAEGHSTSPAGGPTGSAPNAPLARAAGLPKLELRADVASASWPPALLGDQLSRVPFLGPPLQGLLARIETSARDNPGIGMFVVPPPQGHHSSRQLGSVSRPAVSTHRLAPQRPSLPAGQQSSSDAVNRSGMLRALAGGDAALPAAVSLATTAQSLDQSSTSAAQTVPSHRRSPHASSRAVGSSVFVSLAPPVSSSLPAGAAAGGASGGVGAGAAAAALLAVAALWLLHALLPGRLALDLSPWKSTMLDLRLERPG
jgi:hypothetical protein